MSTATQQKFKYSGRDRAGAVKRGTLEAASQQHAVQRMRELGLVPVKLSETGTGLQKEITLPGLGAQVKLKDLAIFSRQFATMINSGLSMLRSLTILAEQTDNKKLAAVLKDVRNAVESGSALSSAMAQHKDVFPPLLINMIKAGEVGGFLDAVLLQVAENFESEVKLRSKVKAAMTYPVVVFVLAILMSVAMLLFIVPVFGKMFADLGAELPAPTRFLLFLSGLLKVLAPLGLVAVVGGAVAYGKTKNRESVRRVVDPLKLRTPIFGNLFRKIALSRFARNLGTMMRSGVPILQALDIVADTTGNYVITKAVRDVQESVRTGESLAKPLGDHPVFPPMVVQMMAVGEDTGALDSMLHKISDFYDQEVEATTESLTALIEPLMIAVLGGLVGSMIVALYLPIFKVFDVIGQQM